MGVIVMGTWKNGVMDPGTQVDAMAGCLAGYL